MEWLVSARLPREVLVHGSEVHGYLIRRPDSRTQPIPYSGCLNRGKQPSKGVFGVFSDDRDLDETNYEVERTMHCL